VQLCIHGRPDLAGPLCHVVLDPHGTCHLVAAGRANHAGAGGWKGLSGNSTVFGIEAVHDGSSRTPWPEEQLAAYVVAAGALARMAGFGPGAICAHREWAPRRKVDPVGVDMDRFRDDVARYLRQAPRPATVTDNPPAPKGVAPMYDPPIGPVAAVWQREGTNDVIAAITPDGLVYAWGTRWAGNVAGKPYWGPRKAAAIGARPDGQPGYRITATSSEAYDLPDGLDAL
jgi:hypothetical protein